TTLWLERAVRRAVDCGARQSPRGMAGDQRPARRSLVLARTPGLGIPGSGTALAGAARWRARAVADSLVPRFAARDEGRRALRTRRALPVLGRGDPGLLPARPLLRPPHQLRGDRQLALLDHPPLGRGLLRALRHGSRRDDVPPDGPRERDRCHARGISGRDLVPRGGYHRHRPPLVLHGPGYPEHGTSLGLFGD